MELALTGARILDANGRRFLEVPRFDRCGHAGRLGVVSLETLHAAAIGAGIRREWTVAAAELLCAEMIDEATLSTIRRLHAFGELIGNSDMHFGNLAFWLDDSLPFRTAPAYDMLPMHWAPGTQGELSDRPFNPSPPLPADASAWQEAASWAEIFWTRLLDEPLLSDEFKGFAATAHGTVRRLRRGRK